MRAERKAAAPGRKSGNGKRARRPPGGSGRPPGRPSELVRVRRAAESERKRFYELLDTLPAYLILLDRDHRIPYMNRFFREMFGDSGGRRCFEYLFHREAPCENCRTYDALKNMAPLEWEWTGPDGRNYYIYDYPFKDMDGSDLIMEVGIDITLQKRAQEELRRANEYNRSLIEASPDPLVTIGADGRVTDVNAATEAVTGQPRHTLIGTDFADYFTDPEKARRGYMRVFEEGSVRDYPLEIRHRDGHVTSVLYNASVYKGSDGEVIGVFAAARDITDLKRAEAELRRALEYNRSLIEASPDPLVTIGADGRITDVNSATEAVTGQQRQKLIGTDFADYFTDPEKARLGYRRVFDEGSVRDYPLDIRHRDGQVTSVLYNASVYRDSTGEVIGVFAAARDVTELQRAEAELRRHKEDLERLVRERTAELERRSGELDAILTSIADPVVVYDRARSPTRLNAAARELLGDGAIGDRSRRAEGTAESADRVAVSLALRGETVRDVEYSITDHHGGTRTFLGSCAPILENAGVAGAVSTLHDITDLKEADRAMQQLVTELATVTGEALRRTDELNSILSAVAVPVVVFDPDGDPVKANPAFQAFFGFDPMGLPGPELHERLDRRAQRTGPSASEEAVREALRGTPAIYREQHAAGEGGSARTLQVSCSPILAGGKPAGAVCSWQDIAK